MIIGIFLPFAGIAVEAGFGRQIHFAANDGLHIDRFGGLIELDRAIEVAVVRDGQGRHLHVGNTFEEFAGFSFFIGEARGAVKKGIFGMRMQMNKRIHGGP